jgi:hypothetical protein
MADNQTMEATINGFAANVGEKWAILEKNGKLIWRNLWREEEEKREAGNETDKYGGISAVKAISANNEDNVYIAGSKPSSSA